MNFLEEIQSLRDKAVEKKKEQQNKEEYEREQKKERAGKEALKEVPEIVEKVLVRINKAEAAGSSSLEVQSDNKDYGFHILCKVREELQRERLNVSSPDYHDFDEDRHSGPTPDNYWTINVKW